MPLSIARFLCHVLPISRFSAEVIYTVIHTVDRYFTDLQNDLDPNLGFERVFVDTTRSDVIAIPAESPLRPVGNIQLVPDTQSGVL